MAKNNFNFQAVLGLETKGFKRGVREVQSSLGTLTSSFRNFAGALAAGFSIGSFISKVKDSTLELSTAMNTLKNVSQLNSSAFSDFGTNLEYIKGLADKYGQSVLSLIDGYAKFTGASYKTGLSLENQKKIFESLTRAAAYYHLSADQTRDMMNAVTQMMSKGKVAAEELRRQLGNSLPGAFNLMAVAMGVSTAELDDMMKKGEVIAAEVLPKFADQLNRVTAGGNFDSLQNSLNKFENAWIGFVQKANFEGLYKGLVDGGTWALDKVTQHSNAISHLLLGALGAGFSQMVRTQSQKAYDNLDIVLRNMEGRLKGFQSTINYMSKRNGTYFATPVQAQGGGTYFKASSQAVEQKGLDKIREMNEMLLKTNKIKEQLGQSTILTDMDVKRIKVINRNLAGMGTSMRGVNAKWAGFEILLGNALKTIKGIGKSLLSFGAVTAIFTAAFWAIGKMIEPINEAIERTKELAKIGNTYNNTIEEGKDHIAQQVRQSNEYLKVIKNTNISLHTRKKALENLSELTNNIEIKDLNIENIKEGTKEYEKLTKAVSKWAESMEKAHIIDIYTREAAKAQVEIDKLQDRLTDLSGATLTKETFGVTGTMQVGMETVPTFGRKIVDTDAGKEVKQINAKIREHQKNIDDARKQVANYNSELDKLLEDYYKSLDGDAGGGGDGGDPVGIDKVFADYKKKIKELESAQKEGALSTKEYNDEFHKLNKDTFRKAAETGKLSIEEITKKFNDGKTLSALEQWYKDLSEAAVKATEHETAREIEEAAERTKKATEEKIKKLSEEFKERLSEGDFVPEEVPGRDTRFDYKKTGTETAGEEYDIASERVENYEKILDELKDKYKRVNDPELLSLISYIDKELKVLKASATNWKEAMTLEEMRQDVIDLYEELKDLQTQLGEGIYGFSTGFISSIDGVVSSFERLQEVSDNMDATGWEQFMATFQVFESIMDSVIGTIQTINTLTELAAQIKEKETQKINAYNQAKMTENSLDLAGGALKQASAAAGTASAIATEAETSAAIAKTTAKSGEAIAEATAAGAKTGFPALLFAIPAAIAAVVAALASVSKFANGGIVGGNSTRGDKNLARVDSGEMILNKSQQGTLFSAIKSGNLGGGSGEWRVRGCDLVKVLENEKNRRRG